MRLENAFTSPLEDTSMYESPTSVLRRSWSNLNLSLDDDIESRYVRASSEERYPSHCRGRSASPYNYRGQRSSSVEPEGYDREASPAREVVAYRRPYQEPPRYQAPRPYSDYYYYRPYSDFYYYDRPNTYYYRPTPPVYPAYEPRAYYDYYNYYYRPPPPSPLYTYSRPAYSRLSPETLRVIADTPKRTPVEKTLTPRDQSTYSSPKPYESYSLSSPRYQKSFTTSITNDTQVYNPAKYRSYFAHPITRGRTRDLGEVQKKTSEVVVAE